MTDHFKSAKAMFAMIAQAWSLPTKGEQDIALGLIPAYKSHGKGRGTPSRKFGNRSGKTYPFQSTGEIVRRRRQIATGQLTAANGLVFLRRSDENSQAVPGTTISHSTEPDKSGDTRELR